uniref:Uncharacterized protein n=1 Tax=Arundo donax TaxID=35708 RepID=A0A0A8ZGH6_ARUDO
MMHMNAKFYLYIYFDMSIQQSELTS